MKSKTAHRASRTVNHTMIRSRGQYRAKPYITPMIAPEAPTILAIGENGNESRPPAIPLIR